MSIRFPVTVLPHREIAAWTRVEGDALLNRNDKPARRFGAWNLLDALDAAHPLDAHVIPYALRDRTGALIPTPRIAKNTLPLLAGFGWTLEYSAILWDADDRWAHENKQPARLEWRAQMREAVKGLPPLLRSRMGQYDSRGGTRGLWTLPRPLGVEEWTAVRDGMFVMLAEHGIDADPFSDFGRSYRLPRVVRDGVKQVLWGDWRPLAEPLDEETVAALAAVGRDHPLLDAKSPRPGPAPVPAVERPTGDIILGEHERPGDWFERNVTWRELLEARGWTLTGGGNGRASEWTRPGKASGISATVTPDDGTLYVFTTSVPPLEGHKAYGKLLFYAVMEHGGNLSAAAKGLMTEYHLRSPAAAARRPAPPPLGEARAPAPVAAPAPATKPDPAPVATAPAVPPAAPPPPAPPAASAPPPPAPPAASAPPLPPPAASAGEIVFELGTEVELANGALRMLEGSGPPFVYDLGTLWRYTDDGVWGPVEMETIENLVAEWDGVYVTSRAAPLRLSQSMLHGVAERACTARVRKGFFDDAPAGLCFTNGFAVADGDAVRLVPHSPDNRCRFRLAHPYERGVEPRLFATALLTAFRDHDDAIEMIEVIQEFIGACLMGLGTKYQKVLLLMGERGDNGKSVILKVISALFPPGVRTAVSPHMMGDKDALADLAGSRLNMCGELEDEEILQASGFKTVVDGGEIRARAVWAKGMTFAPKAGHIFNCNTPPGVRDKTDGFWRRWLVVPFTRKIPPAEQVPEFEQVIIAAELGAIGSWALDGVVRLIARRKYAPSPTCLAALNQWRHESDPVLAFLSEMTDPIDTSEAKHWTECSELYKAYGAWCESSRHRPVTQTTFGKRLRILPGIEVTKWNTMRVNRCVRGQQHRNSAAAAADGFF